MHYIHTNDQNDGHTVVFVIEEGFDPPIAAVLVYYLALFTVVTCPDSTATLP